ncbi:hemerythrin domain-containing protein [Cryptosporangium aurantiacum]|uniref:Hemerythrin HHE cation binding domain-containing protein n=1 Tax=Cryptosporangium aurantiacum TaxID=134849 RepID=A0A1M7MSG2_9ACTN|nr:hemerythrin domain-containing protein [Cryptosporangium aurantiacum]SHM94020.1 Hemerythrin HHE cation binding domain-containing protein [Cryptosporangium aurantiacum]
MSTKPDLLGIGLIHRAMRGDVRALAATAATFAEGRERCTPRRARFLRAHLDEVCDAIHHHHRAEDDVLWPALERSAGGAVELAGLTADHAELDPVLDRIRAAAEGFAVAPNDLAAAGAVARELADLRDLLDEHIEEEERTVFPAIIRYLSVAEWKDVEAEVRKGGGKPSFVLPWVLRYVGEDELAALRREAGPALVVMNTLLGGRYRRRARVIFG